MPPSDLMKSVDGTIKYLYPAGPGNFVESVYIPTEDRATLCVSSQVGCKMNCLFCMTGKQGFTKNLSANELLNHLQSGNLDRLLRICLESEANHGFNYRGSQRVKTVS